MKKIIITALFALVAMAGQAQPSFDAEGGCLNVVDFCEWLKLILSKRLIPIGMIIVVKWFTVGESTSEFAYRLKDGRVDMNAHNPL